MEQRKRRGRRDSRPAPKQNSAEEKMTPQPPAKKAVKRVAKKKAKKRTKKSDA